jgi:hypothetical protein
LWYFNFMSEVLPSFDSAIDAIGNHPAKMVTLLVLAENSSRYYSRALLDEALMEVQGDDPGWPLLRGGRGTRGLPFSYCEGSIEPIGMLVEGKIASQLENRLIGAYQISEAGLQVGVPLSGAFLGWELGYEETSLQQLLGSSNSRDRIGRMPSLRTKIYEHLLSAADHGMSHAGLRHALGETAGRFMQLIPNLRDAGIIDVTERYDPMDRKVTLHAPDFMNLRIAGPRVHPETRAIFDVAQKLVDGDRTKMTGQDLLDAITEAYPQYDQRIVWQRLTIARANDRMGFVEFAPFEGDTQQHTNIAIAPFYEEPIAALLWAIRSLKEDADYREGARQQAHEIIQNPELVSQLMAKARENSAHANSLPNAEWHSIILQHIPAEGIDARALYETVKSIAPPVSYTYFRRFLTEQNGEGFKLEGDGAEGRMRKSIGRITLSEL